MSTNLRAQTLTRPTNHLAADDADLWREQAACIDQGDLFYMEGAAAEARAKTICRGCPVRAACLADAIKHDERFGVWGGMDPNERARRAQTGGNRG